MPEIFPPAVATPSSDTGPQIAAAVIALLTADPEVGVDGALGVAWIGSRWPQQGGAKREWQSFSKASRPAIAVDVTRQGSVQVLTDTRATVYRVSIATSVDKGSNLEGRELTEKIKDRALSLIASVRGSGAFVEGVQVAMEPDSEQAGEPVLSSDSGKLFLCESTIDLGVLWSGVVTEV